MAAYEEIGFKRGRSIIAKLLQYLVNDLKTGVIKKDKIFLLRHDSDGGIVIQRQ